MSLRRHAPVLLLLVAAVAVLTLAMSPTMTGGNRGASSPDARSSGTYSPSLAGDAPAVPALRNDPRDAGFDRALKDRQPLLGIVCALLFLAALACRRSVLAAHLERLGAAQSPLCSGRGPPSRPVLA